MLSFEVWNVAPSCWKQPFQSCRPVITNDEYTLLCFVHHSPSLPHNRMTRLCSTWRHTPVVVPMTSGCQRAANKYRHAFHEARYVVIYACSKSNEQSLRYSHLLGSSTEGITLYHHPSSRLRMCGTIPPFSHTSLLCHYPLIALQSCIFVYMYVHISVICIVNSDIHGSEKSVIGQMWPSTLRSHSCKRLIQTHWIASGSFYGVCWCKRFIFSK